MNKDKLIEIFLRKITTELYDLRMEFNAPTIRQGDLSPELIGRLDKMYNWLDDVIKEIEEVLK